MKRILTIVSLGVLTASSALCQIIAQPQTATTSETSQGSLGQRYVGVGFGVGDRSYTADNVYGAAAGVNVPVTSFLDVSGGYSYSWYKRDWEQYSTDKYDAHSLNMDFVFYKQIAGGLKPFVSAGVGYSWYTMKIESHSSYLIDGKISDSSATWDTSVGIEIPFRWVALTPSIGLGGNFENSRSQDWHYGLQASSWVTSKVGILASVAYIEPRSSDYDGHTWSYTAGVRIKF